MSDERNYKISILGDSISTYEGYLPYGYPAYYREDVNYDNGLESVDDTWWMQVINALGVLCVNNSFSGSFVAGNSPACASSDERCSALHGESTPELILIYMGTNDRGLGLEIGAEKPLERYFFYGAYRLMLQKIKKNYPAAKIVCATLPAGRDREGRYSEYDVYNEKDSRYDEAIRAAVKEENCLLADLAAFKERYDTRDLLHPDRNGHKLLASLWLKELSALL